MQIHVRLESVSKGCFRACTRGAQPLCAEGATSDEALSKLGELLESKLGPEARAITLFPDSNPWALGSGMFKDDQYSALWMEEIVRRRDEIESDPSIP